MGTTINTYYNGLDFVKGRPIVLESLNESWTINFADSAACKYFKIGTGTGESRLFIGQSSILYSIQSFFNTNVFFFNTSDLLSYLIEAKGEYDNPSQDYMYKDSLQKIYASNVHQIKAAKDEYISLRYRLSVDPNRCYLVLDPSYRKDYKIFRDICIPRMTEIVFEKYYSVPSNEVFIKMTPFFRF